MSALETCSQRFYRECGNAVRVKIDIKDQNGSFYVNQVRETNILISVCKAAKISIRKIKTIGKLPDRKGNWFIQFEDDVSEEEKNNMLGVNGMYFDAGTNLNRKFTITDIADGDEIIDMKFSIHFLPVNFELEKIKEYFERIGFTNVNVVRNKIKLDKETFEELDFQKEIYTNLIFVKAKLKKKEKSPIVCGYRKLFGYEPRIDIIDRIKRCRLCKKEGHLADSCKGKNIYCAKCKQQGHSENECSIAYMLQKGLYSQIDSFDDSDEMKFNCLTQDTLNKKKESWKKTKDFKEKKEKEKNERENSIKQFSNKKSENKKVEEEKSKNIEKQSGNTETIIAENEKNLNDKRNHSVISSTNDSPNATTTRIKKKRGEFSNLYNIILEVYAEDNEGADNLEEYEKEEIEEACFEQISSPGDCDDPEIYSDIKEAFTKIYRKYISEI